MSWIIKNPVPQQYFFLINILFYYSLDYSEKDFMISSKLITLVSESNSNESQDKPTEITFNFNYKEIVYFSWIIAKKWILQNLPPLNVNKLDECQITVLQDKIIKKIISKKWLWNR